MKQIETQEILNCQFSTVTEQGLLEWITQLLDSPNRGYITTVNVAILMMMRSDARLKSFIDASTITIADGQPLIWLSKLLRRPIPERITGIDLCQEIAKSAARDGKSIYLLGASEAVLLKTEQKLMADNPGLIIAGRSNGYFKPEQDKDKALQVKNSGADILFVAMGVPRQEYFIQDNWDSMGVKLTLPVGGSFDVLAGAAIRAPKWMQNSGLEWLFRLIQEPRRLFKRYAVTNTQFVFLSLGALLRR